MSANDILCGCVKENIPDPACSECGGRGTICLSCGNLGRVADAPCPRCDAGRDYFASLPPSSEAERLARELAIMLA